MEEYSFNISISWNKVDAKSILTIGITYNPEVVGDAIEKFKTLWEREFIGLLSDSSDDFTVETPIPEGQDDDVLMYGGEKLSFSIDSQEAMLPTLEKYLREHYALGIFQRRFDGLTEEFCALVPGSYICGGSFIVCRCGSDE